MARHLREIHVRPLAAGIATTLLVTIVAAWGFVTWGAESRKRWAPLIAYHETQYRLNRDRWQNDLDRAKALMDRTHTLWDGVTRKLDDAASLPERPQPFKTDALRRVEFESRGFVEEIDGVRKRLRDASLHEKMTLYHFHLRRYYEELLNARLVLPPPLPAKLDSERKLIELTLRRRYGEAQWDDSEERSLLHQYESEPPRRFMAGGEKP